MNIKITLVALALVAFTSPALANHEEGHPALANGPITPTTRWEVVKARTFVNGASSEAPVVLKVVNSEAEFLRVSMLDLARLLVEAPVKSTWKGTMIQTWIDRYLAGER